MRSLALVGQELHYRKAARPRKKEQLVQAAELRANVDCVALDKLYVRAVRC